MGWLGNWAVGTPKVMRNHVVAAAGFGNLNSLPLLIATAMCQHDSLPFLPGEHAESAMTAERAKQDVCFPACKVAHKELPATAVCHHGKPHVSVRAVPSPLPVLLQRWAPSAAVLGSATLRSALLQRRCSHVSSKGAAPFLCFEMSSVPPAYVPVA